MRSETKNLINALKGFVKHLEEDLSDNGLVTIDNIILTGYNGVGKDTVARMINYIFYKNNHRKPMDFSMFRHCTLINHYQELAFAKPVKEIYALTNHMPVHEVEKQKRESKKVRDKIIKLAENMKDIFGDDLWIKNLEKSLKIRNIITDLRFVNELEFVKTLPNNIIIGIVNSPGADTPQPYDALFVNNKKDFGTLEKEVTKLLKEIKLIN